MSKAASILVSPGLVPQPDDHKCKDFRYWEEMEPPEAHYSTALNSWAGRES